MRIRTWLRPVLVGVVTLLWLGVAGAIGGPLNSKLSEVQENDESTFLPESAESTLAGIERDKFSEQDNISAVIVLDGVTDPAQVDEFATFVDSLRSEPLPAGEDGAARTLGDVIVGDVVVSPSADGEAAIALLSVPFAVAFESNGEGVLAQEIVSVIRDAWEAGDYAGDLHVTGAMGLFADQFAAFAGIDGILLGVALLVVFLILLIVYRSPVLPVFVLLTAVLGLCLLAMVVYALAKADVLTLNGQSQGIMSILVVGATTDYALLLVSRYREELRRVASPYAAMWKAWRRAVEPIAASAVTVVLGLLTLLFSDLASNQSLGPVAALGIISAVCSSLTFLPAILLIGGKRARWVFWPRRPKFDEAEAHEVDTLESVERHAGVWGRVSRAVAGRPRRTWAAALLGLGILAAFLPTFHAEGVGADETILGEPDSVLGLQVYQDHFAAGAANPIEIVVSEDDWPAVSAAVGEVDGIYTVYALTPAVAVGGPPVPAEAPKVVDGRVVLIAVSQVGSETQEAKDVVVDVRAAAHAVDPSALVGGAAAVRLDIIDTTARDLTVIIPLVLVVIFVVLVLLLRAVVAPLVIVAANLLSFAATLGLAALVFNHLLGFPGSDPAVPLFSFVFLVALGVDYSIFLMSRVREESLKHGTREGARRGLAVTGGVITSAGIVLAATFGALAVIPILFMVQMAFIVASGVLIDTFVVRTLLVPGGVIDLGRLSWWPWQRKLAD